MTDEQAAEHRRACNRLIWTIGTRLDRAEDAGHHDVTEAIHEALDAAMAVLRKFEAIRRYIAQREDGLR